MKKAALFFSFLLASLTLLSSGVWAAEPHPVKLGMQAPASPNMERLHAFHDGLLMPIITAIVIFVFILLAIVIFKYNRKANPKPAQFTHNVPLEIVWTVIPIVILIIIAIPSFNLLFYLDRAEKVDLTLKVSGYQWGWAYSYPDLEIEEYRADMITDEDLPTYIPDQRGRRLLETYNPIVLPINQNIQITTTASDVIHSWTIPAFGVKKDAVPGRTNETWVRISKPGVYYGQCSEICGISHAFMPISIYAVSEEEFKGWTECVKGEGASADFPARACVQKLGFDKYRASKKTLQEFAQVTGEE